MTSTFPRKTLRLLILVAALSGSPGGVQYAWSQANSDFIAYPNGFDTIDGYRQDPRQLTFNRLPGVSAEYQLGAGDELEVTVVGVSTNSYKMDSGGRIDIPLVGELSLADMTAEEAEQTIGSALESKGLVRDPEVLIFVSAYQAKPIYAVGDVDRPGQYMMSQNLRLMDFIFLCGGIDLPADRWAYLHRRIRTDSAHPEPPAGILESPDLARPGFEVVKIDLQPAKEGGIVSPNLLMREGDVLVVPRREMAVFYVVGDAQAPGAFEWRKDEKLSVSMAIAKAGGPTSTARISDGIVVRYTDEGVREELPADFQAILTGRQPDFEVRANDVIFIPGSAAKSFSQSMLGTIPGVVTGAIFVR